MTQAAEQQCLRHVVVRPDQDQHAVAAVGVRLQVPGGYPGRLQRAFEHLVQGAPQLALGPVVARGRSLNVNCDYQAVHGTIG